MSFDQWLIDDHQLSVLFDKDGAAGKSLPANAVIALQISFTKSVWLRRWNTVIAYSTNALKSIHSFSFKTNEGTSVFTHFHSLSVFSLNPLILSPTKDENWWKVVATPFPVRDSHKSITSFYFLSGLAYLCPVLQSRQSKLFHLNNLNWALSAVRAGFCSFFCFSSIITVSDFD